MYVGSSDVGGPEGGGAPSIPHLSPHLPGPAPIWAVPHHSPKGDIRPPHDRTGASQFHISYTLMLAVMRSNDGAQRRV